jgi:hypothetical protein
LFEEKRALEAHLLDAALHARESGSGGVIGFFNFVQSSLEVYAFTAVCLFDGWRECWWDSPWMWY